MRAAFTIAMASLLAACGTEPGVYKVPLPEALARLEKADLDGFRMARQCGILIHLRAGTPRDNAITWHVSSSGSEVLNFTVRLAADGSGTRATIEVPPDPEGGEIYDGSKFYPRPAVNQPLRPAIQELIDAAMEQRPYDVMRIPDPRNTDKVCNVQRAGLESGSFVFGVNDRPGMDSRQSADAEARDTARRSADEFDSSYGQPMDSGAGGY